MSSISSFKSQGSFTSSSSSTALAKSEASVTSASTTSTADGLERATADIFRDTFSHEEVEAAHKTREPGLDGMFLGTFPLMRMSAKAMHRRRPFTSVACAMATPVTLGASTIAIWSGVGTLLGIAASVYADKQAKHPKPEYLRKLAILKDLNAVDQDILRAVQCSAHEVLKVGRLDPATLQTLRIQTQRGWQAFDARRKGTELGLSAQLDRAGEALQARVSSLPALLVSFAHQILAEKAKAEWTTEGGRAKSRPLSSEARELMALQWARVLTWLESLPASERGDADRWAQVHTRSLAKKFGVKVQRAAVAA